MLALRAARLFDGERTVERPLVLVEDGRIVAVEHGRAQPPADAQVHDFGEATILPGLIDCHVHLAFTGPEPVERVTRAEDAELFEGMLAAAASALAAGITTVRDLGDRGFLALELRDRFRSGAELGPEILAAGPPITCPDGHAHYLGGVASGVDELRTTIRTWAERGVDVIKVMASGGVLTEGTDPLTPQFSSEELEAVVDEAHRFGLPVTAHAHGAAPIAQAVQAGLDGLEHVSFWTQEGTDPDEWVIDEIIERQIAVTPTFGLVPGSSGPPPFVFRRTPQTVETWGRLFEAGARMAIGTDAGITEGKPHDVLPHTLCNFEEHGWDRSGLLRSVTSVAADVLGVADRKGTVRAGKEADLLVVDGDPLSDIAALRAVRAVFRAGTPVGGAGRDPVGAES